ncbi:MAG: YebC/PmpR family DNA-binding transcriptional regulator [Gemmatimonadales bacterium]|nr:YebC/PmpR family DNA-binding transcriptional regulator [Gemmatimonadales bacterium]MBP6570818.1 YebC/PmpR family DNA-binding transcriptional regulator [Gemmatimonadales bacterium]MBP7620306.1 YebC/PmpR family DNA-binding transcriptional regulator [Gemmatimonadales bacterium]
MAGHSKWKTIKRKKAITDSRRASSWTKLIREITVAAKAGGGDPGSNARLRKAIDDAKAANMPGDNIERAVKKGTGELEGVSYEEVTYEGYGAGGVAILIEGSTDNANRTVADIRHAFSRNSGNLGTSNSVSWMFEKKGQIFLPITAGAEEKVMEDALDAGASDFEADGEYYVISTDPHDFHAVTEALAAKKYVAESSELAMVPKNLVKLEMVEAQKVLKLVELLEELDDVSKVFTTLDLDALDLEEAGA